MRILASHQFRRPFATLIGCQFGIRDNLRFGWLPSWQIQNHTAKAQLRS